MTLDEALLAFIFAVADDADSYALAVALADLRAATRTHINDLHEQETR
ncbi:hypothetical protein [Arthrobacter roseus]|nr:hypothetical protein [Arthrobacter roseus]MBM7847501.1 hypothetical protein [Arthrobacter roseus]